MLGFTYEAIPAPYVFWTSYAMGFFRLLFSWEGCFLFCVCVCVCVHWLQMKDGRSLIHHRCLNFLVIWDEVPTMVEIVIFWSQIHITNALNFMHRKWYTGNQYMVKSAENRMRSTLELLPVINVKSRPRYISTLFWCTEWAWNWQIIFRFASIHVRACFNRWKEHPYIVLQYTPKSTKK